MLLACVLALLDGCASVRVARTSLPAELAWPAALPRVRLERIVAHGQVSGLRSLLGGNSSSLFERPYGVAWDGDDLIVADPGARRLARIGSDGRVAFSRPDVAGAPMGVAACEQGLVTTDPADGRVALLDRDLRRIAWLGEGLERPTGVTCAGAVVYVAETGRHQLVVLEPTGLRKTIGGRGEEAGRFNFPVALALSGRELYVGDTLNFRVQRLDLDGGGSLGAFGRLGDAPGDMPRLKGLAVDAAGQVWVSDERLESVSLYTPQGELLISLGGPGDDPGRFAFPAGIASHPDGRVAVVDSLNRRVQIFRLVPPLRGSR